MPQCTIKNGGADKLMDIERLKAVLRELGVVRLYTKELAPNDNSKNQIYLAGDLGALHEIPHGTLEQNKTKHGINLKAPVKLFWIDEEGKAWAAPQTQLILYPQYPEVRLSGVLKGTEWAPSSIVASRSPHRILVLGTTSDGKVYGAAADGQSDLARSLATEEEIGNVGALKELQFERQQTRRILLDALSLIAAKGWIASKRLDRNGSILPCNAPNCGGLTLEAELGIRPNSISGPDFHGWEIKQHGVANLTKPGSGVLTLMTPEPDGGDYKARGVGYFIEKYGYEDREGRQDRFNFGGIYKVGKPAALTGLKMEIVGFDNKRIAPDGSVVLLTDKDHVAASWSFATLLTIWTRKHAQAAFVPSIVRKNALPEYRYGHSLHLGMGTDFSRFLASMTLGCVYYDPGIKLEKIGGKAKIKRRSQFRVNFRDLPALYALFERADSSGKS